MLAITLFATLMTMVTSIEAAPLEAKHATRDLVSRATPSVPSSGTSIGQGYVVQGCYSDSWWSSAFDYTSSSSSMTQESCAAQCYAAKKPYMAVENGSDCYCGYDFNWFSGSSQVANSNCNYACSGNSKQNCGGYYNMVVFKYGGSFTATTSAAASSAKSSAAASSSASSAAVSSSSAAKSSAAPSSSSSAAVSSSSAAKSSAAASSSSSAAPSSSSAAVSSSSSSVAKSSAAVSSTSSSAAAASSSAASLTGLTTTNGWTSQGCYQDAWPHLVPDYFERQSYMTQEYCGTQCFNMGKPYMAVEYGTDCYCASSLATGSAYPKLADNQCSYPCGGNSAENCGGNWILVLFKYTGTASFPSSSSASSAIASSSVASASASVSSAAVSSSAAQSSAIASSSSAPASSAAASSAAVVSSAPASSAAASSSAPVSSAAASSAAPIVLPSAAASVVNSVVPSLAPSSTSSAAVVIPTVIAIDPLAVPTPWIAASVPVIAEATYDVKRALTGSSLSSDDMTYTKCLNFCSSGGFALAGLEYGRECYCGNYLTNGASLSLPATATMTCAGANSTSTALCGGPNAITLFYQPTKISGLASDFTTRTATLASGWSAASTPCLQEGSSQRVLSLDSYFSDNMTTSSCVAYCDSKGFGYAGIEYGRECYCGNSLNSNVISNSCNMACAGDSIQTCGGPNAISLFRNPSLPKINSVTLPSGWSAASSTCIQEVSGRALNGASTSGSDMTVPKCLNFCSSKGFQYGAVEYGSECYCGSSLVNGASLSLTSGQCNVACAGDSTNNCGGPNALQLYVNPSLSPVVNSVNGFANSGCIQEVAGRALTGASTTATNMTAAVCTSYCQSQGFTMAGVEYGQECYCGNSLVNGASTALTSGQCVMPCAGDATTICGGPNAINLYTVSSS